jgi:acyl-CoA thioester hydrolase
MPGHTEPAAFRWSAPIRFGDTDPYGVVYFVSYFRVKEALDEFLRARGLPPEDCLSRLRGRTRSPRGGEQRPVPHAGALRGCPDVGVTVQACSEKSVTFGFRSGEGREGTGGQREITCVAIDAGWRSIPLPQSGGTDSWTPPIPLEPNVSAGRVVPSLSPLTATMAPTPFPAVPSGIACPPRHLSMTPGPVGDRNRAAALARERIDLQVAALRGDEEPRP